LEDTNLLDGRKRMKYEKFLEFIEKECMYETMYKDSEGRDILVICMLDARMAFNRYHKKLQENEND
jgi:hypothetical protein